MTDTGAASDTSSWFLLKPLEPQILELLVLGDRHQSCKQQFLELQTTDTTGAQAGATDTGAYESKLQRKLLELQLEPQSEAIAST